MKTIAVVMMMAVGLICEAALGHVHLSLDTTAGNVGDPIMIKAGYLAEESDVSIDASRRIWDGLDIFVAEMNAVQVGGVYDGWFKSGAEVNPSNDFFVSSGRLGTGVFAYEILEVEPVSGFAHPRFVIAWTSGGGGMAESFAETQAGRSIPVPPGTHRHSYAWYFSRPGEYDVTLRAWDASGQFVSLPGGVSDVTFRLDVVPEPVSGVVMVLGGMMIVRRRCRMSALLR